MYLFFFINILTVLYATVSIDMNVFIRCGAAKWHDYQQQIWLDIEFKFNKFDKVCFLQFSAIYFGKLSINLY